jgi:hypothetical protein
MPMTLQPPILAIWPATGSVAGRAGDHHGVAGERLAEFAESEVGGHAGAAERAEVLGQQFVVLELIQFARRLGRVLLPAERAIDLVAGLERRIVRLDHFAEAPGAHDIADVQRRGIAADVFHLTFLRGVEAQIERAHQHLAGLRRPRLADLPLEIAFQQHAVVRPGRDQPLTVGEGHGGSFMRRCRANPAARYRPIRRARMLCWTSLEPP